MSANPDIIMDIIEPGRGYALDVGGGRGILYDIVREKGYDYVNIDLNPLNREGYPVKGDCHYLPFRDESFSLIISKDTLEHFRLPQKVVDEIQRVLIINGYFILWVPFLHPFHGNDYFRYTPLGIKYLLREFEILSIESPLWLFSFLGGVINQILKRLNIKFVQQKIRSITGRVDRLIMRHLKGPSGYAYGYRVIARKIKK